MVEEHVARVHRVGAFEVAEPLGRGGMAQVWRGLHRPSGVAVALKLVTTDAARERYLREALHNEVRAMARLDHPHVVWVFDYGQVPREAEASSEGALLAGTPYLAMELAEGGTLRAEHVRSWAELRALLSALLGALAHAHARGVIHRDIKPSNVLIGPGGVADPRLSDFGISSALLRTEAPRTDVPLSAGTAWFMAPEQILGLYRDEGPWTDLYSLGCLAFLLATGGLPYPGRDREQVYRAHCLAAVPPLEPHFAVPEDLEAWIAVLLAKAAGDRFELAADALAALASLGPATRPAARAFGASPSQPPPSSERTATMAQSGVRVAEAMRAAETALVTVTTAVPAIDADAPAPALSTSAQALRHAALPAMGDEAGPPPRAATRSLLGAGLGLFGLRPIPLAGREEERRALWDCLRQVREERRPHAVILEGRAGYGKTKLGEWLTERASEAGVATSLWTGHGPTPSPSDGIARIVLHHLRAEGLDADETAARLRSVAGLDGGDEAAIRTRAQLLELLHPDTAKARVSRPEERFAALGAFFAALSMRRPLVVVVDDAHRGAESLAFVEHLLERGASSGAALLAILTVRSDQLDERPANAAALAALAARDDVTRLELGALGDDDHERLIERLLGLEGALAAAVRARTGGNPLFAIQLVGDWVERGHLVLGPRGFELAEGVVPDIPDDIHALWRERIERVIGGMDPAQREPSRIALEVAALLGRRTSLREHARACELAGAPVPEGLLDALANGRIALVGRSRLALVHGMLHESLERSARDQGRVAELHHACAAMLRELPASTEGRDERLGRHLVAAGEGLAAAAPLAAAAHARLLTCEFAEVLSLIELRDRGLDEAGIAGDDPRRLAGWAIAADALGVRGELDACEALLDRAEPIARASGDSREIGTVLRLRGGVALKRGRLTECHAWYEEALSSMGAAGDDAGRASALHGLGECEKLLGDLDSSETRYLEARGLLEASGGDVLQIGRADIGLADVQRRRGDLARSRETLSRALAVMREIGNGHSVGVALNSVGDIDRIRGDLEGAEAAYGEALGVFEQLGSQEATIVRLNLGLVMLARGRFTAAYEVFDAARPALDRTGREGYFVYVLAGLAAAGAGRRDRAALDENLARFGELAARVGIVDDDLAWCAERAGELAAAAGWTESARAALELARAQWSGLERADATQRIDARLAGLG